VETAQAIAQTNLPAISNYKNRLENRIMKNRLLSFAGALALLAVLGHYYAKPLMAQVRATVVKNVDERGRNPYLQSLACYSSTTNQCAVFFPAVPAGMTLVIEHISVSADTPTPLQSVDIYGNGIIQSIYMPLQGTDSQGNSIYTSSQPYLSYYTAGQTPSAAINTKSAGFEFISGSVTFTGYLVNLSQ
jgi:hypothetical protein